MKTWMKATICTMLSFMFCFMTLGYAALTDTLNIRGSVDITIPEGLFIISVSSTPTSQSRVDHSSLTYIPYSTTVDCIVDKGSSNRYAGTVTYEVTVLNNTEYEYAYRDIYYQSSIDGYNGNGYVSTSNGNSRIGISTSFPNGSKVAPGDTLVFYVTYTVGMSMNANTDWRSLVNIRFGINVDSEEEARVAVISKFENILNSPSTYATLYDKIDDKFSGAEWTSNYIGNVTDSSSDDSTTVNTLFAGQLQMVIDGVDNPITVLIKHENVDGNRQTGDDYTAVSGNNSFTGYGCEFTLYMTTSDLSDRSVAPPVYAAAFTCDRNADGSIGKWYMLGEPYAGTASIVGYEGGESTGSFDTGTWRAYSATYTPSENYSYSINAGATIQTVTQTVDPNAIAALEELLVKAKEIIDGDTYAGTGLVALENAYYNASKYYTVNADGTISVPNSFTRVQLIPPILALEQALNPFENIQ